MEEMRKPQLKPCTSHHNIGISCGPMLQPHPRPPYLRLNDRFAACQLQTSRVSLEEEHWKRDADGWPIESMNVESNDVSNDFHILPPLSHHGIYHSPQIVVKQGKARCCTTKSPWSPSFNDSVRQNPKLWTFFLLVRIPGLNSSKLLLVYPPYQSNVNKFSVDWLY